MIQYGLYISVLTVGLVLLLSSNYSQIDLVVFWSICALLTHFPFTIYFILQLRKTLQFKIDYIRVVKFLVIALFSFGSISLFLETSLNYDDDLFVFLPDLLKYIIFSAFIYFVLTFFVDQQTRILIKNIFNELKH
tara:strand:- start:222 stop:626 length:405 start_codon:yes stop_codon:yes gene_type:complete